MSDFTIPGVNNKYFSDEQIEDMVELEARPIRRLEGDNEIRELEKESWQEIGRRISNLQGAARNLFGVDSPFRDRTAESSDEAILTAQAGRNGTEERAELIVRQTAAADRFASNPLPEEIEIPAGEYGFTIGDEEHSLRFRGGDIDSFASAVNSRLGEHLRARIVQDTPSSKRFIIESLDEGEDNRLGFQDNFIDIALDIGLVSRSLTTDMSVALPENLQELLVSPESTRRIPLPAIAPGGNMRLQFEMRIDVLDESSRSVPAPPPGPSLPEQDSVQVRDVRLPDQGLALELPDTGPQVPPPPVTDDRIVHLDGSGSSELIPTPVQTQGYEMVEISISDYLAGSPEALEIRNNNSLKNVFIRNVRIYDPDSRGDYVPENPLSTARNAIVSVDGIDFTRNSNKIEDLIPGTTINLRRASDNPVEVTVGPDREAAKNAIIEFAGYYNQLMTEILILSRSDDTIIDEIEYFDSDEREEAQERMGRMQGDSTLNQISRAMKAATSAPYETDMDREMALLAQIGVSTSSANQGGGFDASRLRGYLQINESQLEDALENNFYAVRQLFGNDTDGDGRIDTGAAFELDRLTRPYVQTGGIIATRTDTIDSAISRAEDQIETYDRRLEDYEADLRRDFARMEGAIQQMEANSQRFENMNPRN